MTLNWEFSDIATIGKSKAPHSLTFNLPFTDTNDLALTGFRNPSSINIDIRATIDCIVYEDDNPILHGSLQVMSMDLHSRDYKCAIYGKAADVYEKLKDKRWVDIFTNEDGTIFQGLDHEKTAANIDLNIQNTDITQGLVGGDVIFYPLQNTALSRLTTGLDFEYYPVTEDALSNDGYQTQYNKYWTAKGHCFGIKVTYLLDRIFEYCGLGLVKNTTFDTGDDRPNFDDMYYMTTPQNQRYRPYYAAEVESIGYYTPLFQSTLNMTGTSTTGFTVMALGTTIADPDDLFNGAGAFVAPVGGTFFFQVNITWTRAGGFLDYWQLGCSPYNTTTGTIYATSWTNFASQSGDTTGAFQQTIAVQLDANDELAFMIHWANIGTGGIDLAADACTVRFTSYLGQSNTVTVPQSMGDESVGEWFEALMKRYNMALQVNNDEKLAYMYLRSQLFDTNVSNAKNWSAKLDRSKSVVMSGNANNLKRVLRFQHENNDNNFGNWWDDTYDNLWDRYSYKSTKDYTQGEEVIGDYFSWPAWMRTPDWLNAGGMVYNNNVDQGAKPLLLQMFKDFEWGGEEWECAPAGNSRFFVYRNTVFEGLDTTYYMYDNEEDDVPYLITRYRRSLPEFYNQVMSWAPKQSWNGLFNTSNDQTLYQTYYQQEVEERYSIDSRIIECDMFVESSDLATMSWGDIIQIDTQYYYLEAVKNYSVGGNKASRVTLRRLLTTGASSTPYGANCNLDLMTVSIDCDGIVTGYDRFGVELPLNEACCDQIGGGNWIWDENSQTCSTGDNCNPSEALGGRYVGGSSYQNPLTSDFAFDPNQKVKRLNDSQVISFTLVASTKLSSTTVLASNSVGVDSFPLPQWSNLGVNVEYIATNTTDADKGDVEFGTWTGVLRTKDFVGDKAGADDVTSRIGDVSPLTIGVQITTVNDMPHAEFYCSGMEADWTLEVRVVARIIVPTNTYPATLNTQSGATIKLQDGFTLIEQ